MKILTSLSEGADWCNGLLQLPERRLTFKTLSGCWLSCQVSVALSSLRSRTFRQHGKQTTPGSSLILCYSPLTISMLLSNPTRPVFLLKANKSRTSQQNQAETGRFFFRALRMAPLVPHVSHMHLVHIFPSHPSKTNFKISFQYIPSSQMVSSLHLFPPKSCMQFSSSSLA